METVIVFSIVVVSAVYVGRSFYKRFKQKTDCACGCAGCGGSAECAAADNGDPAEDAPHLADR